MNALREMTTIQGVPPEVWPKNHGVRDGGVVDEVALDGVETVCEGLDERALDGVGSDGLGSGWRTCTQPGRR